MCSCGNRNKTENVDNQIDTTEVVDSVENTL
nr:MAG TPA: Transcription factor COE1/DNA factor, pseudo-Ig-fold, TIG-domain, IPT-domain [Bacteriophage sp.]